jgi:O-acetyl-ADP-ribose deacetylase (regulator of RNase III)
MTGLGARRRLAMAKLSVSSGDITTQVADAIVNAANRDLRGGGGVDGAIHAKGGPSILVECRAWVSQHGPLPTGGAMATGAGEMTARFVIHTVGPIWSEHPPQRAASLLGDCYRNSLALAADLMCESVAFPNISTGVYGFPKPAAAEVAMTAVRGWVESHSTPGEIRFVCFDDENLGLYESLLGG